MSFEPLILAAAPLLLALLVWAVIDLEGFVLYVVLPSAIYPATLAKPGGANVALVDIMLVIALISWLINNAIGNAPDPWIRRNWLFAAGVAFAALPWVSLIWSVNPHKTISFGIKAVELFVLFPLIFASVPTDLARIRRGMNIYLVLSVLMALALVGVFLTHSTAQHSGTYLPGVNKNAAGSFEAVGIIIAATLVLRRDHQLKWPWGVMMIDVIGLAASESRGAMLGAAAGLLLISLMTGRGRLVIVFVVAMIAGSYFTVVAPGIAVKTHHAAGSYSSSNIRILIWRNAWHKIEARPFFGTGSGTYLDPQYGQTDPNNTILLTWAEDGIPGLVLLATLIGTFAAVARRVLRPRSSESAMLGLAATATVLCLLVHFEVDVTWARGAASLMLAMMGLVAGLRRMSMTTQGKSEQLQDAWEEPLDAQPVHVRA